jgi:anti-sigma regulatory factor (Ser/Thr protein kinase)
MKTGILTTKTIASEDIKDTKSIMGMSSKGMEMAQYFLRDKIYSDKILAVVREYISNAWDEHKKFNIDKPVKVSLVAHDNQFIWSVRDYAMGLDEHDIRNVFGMYFESTKSNENNSIGGFGIGGKAAFSYIDTFYVNSYHNGTKTNYVCTLGAGTKGIPVGEIYKISEEPTTEQGIEISLEISGYSDPDAFNTKTTKFVQFFDQNSKIEFKGFEGLIKPLLPLNSKTVGEYTFHQYEESPHYRGSQQYFIRMGGVVYPHKAKHTSHRNFSNKNVVVDVPIGKLSIPISRESIETTPLNDKVFAEIESILDGMIKDEVDALTVPKFGALATGHASRNKDYDGEWFVHAFNRCFPTTSSFLVHTRKNFQDVDGTTNVVSSPTVAKHIIYLMPNIKSTKNWHKRLISALTKVQGCIYNGYAYMSKGQYEIMLTKLDNTIDISDCHFVDVKTLKLPKLERLDVDTNTYLVYDNYACKSHKTAEELEEFVIKKYFKDEEPDDDWYTKVEDMDALNKRTVGKVQDYGTRSSFWTVNSVRMIENLKELGWLTPASPEYVDMKNKFNEKAKQERIIYQAKNSLEEIYFGTEVNPRLVKIIGEKPDKISRLKNIQYLLLKEDTTRGRILKTFSTYNHKINREDLRKILMMKD